MLGVLQLMIATPENTAEFAVGSHTTSTVQSAVDFVAGPKGRAVGVATGDRMDRVVHRMMDSFSHRDAHSHTPLRQGTAQ
jgi:hypothetical protein